MNKYVNAHGQIRSIEGDITKEDLLMIASSELLEDIENEISMSVVELPIHYKGNVEKMIGHEFVDELKRIEGLVWLRDELIRFVDMGFGFKPEEWALAQLDAWGYKIFYKEKETTTYIILKVQNPKEEPEVMLDGLDEFTIDLINKIINAEIQENLNKAGDI